LGGENPTTGKEQKMATENPGPLVTREAGSNVTNKRFVVNNGVNKVDRASVAGSQVDGVAVMTHNVTGATVIAGTPVAICKSGTVIVECGGNVATGAIVMTDSVGRAVTWTGDDPAEFAVGKNIGEAGALGKDIPLELFGLAQTPGVAP
jgi:hypothetical protein